MTEKEKQKAMVRLGSNDNLNELQDSIRVNGGAKTVIDSFQDYDKISKGFNVPTPVKGSNAVDFTQRLLKTNGGMQLSEAIDVAIGLYQKDNRPMFQRDINIAFDDEKELRTYILKQWIMKYQKNDQNIFQRTVNETGTVSNPENTNTLSSIYGNMWGQE
tara:strand:- start:40 stop:519 length:480 start_codon:yes stop_codon:yes gene_type:complete